MVLGNFWGEKLACHSSRSTDISSWKFQGSSLQDTDFIPSILLSPSLIPGKTEATASLHDENALKHPKTKGKEGDFYQVTFNSFS